MADSSDASGEDIVVDINYSSILICAKITFLLA
jgi:hypothetical protein